ncbi:GumC family protein [Foetidibacter luteolus]|uniref:GumC family protein n=1 Tax=Foetidibacter luteolus TaxID=2608880 RepID=UPI001A98DDBE|nr:polysaccharide biosynthesis tyrosine autokinase [Foetidibacter luteolus]
MPWIILSVILCYTVARLYLRYTPRLHKVSSYVLIKEDEESSSDYRILKELGVMPGSRQVQDQINILESFELSLGIVDSLDLQIQMVAQGRIASSPLYGDNLPVVIKRVKTDTSKFIPGVYKLFVYHDRFLIERGNSKSYYRYNDTFSFAGKKLYARRNTKIKPDKEGYTLIIAEAAPIARSIRGGIYVQKMNDMGNIIEISMLDEIPQRAIDIINKLVEAYNTAGLTDKNVVGFKTISFLNDRIASVSGELDEIEGKAEAFKRESKITDFSAAGSQFLSQSMEFDNQKMEQEVQLQMLESLEKYIRNTKTLGDIIPANGLLKEPAVEKLIQDYDENVILYQNQSKISTDKDPTLIRLKGELAELKNSLIKSIEGVKKSYLQRLNTLGGKQTEFDNKLAALPKKERDLLNLKRQSGVKEALYLYLLQKKEETELSMASNINNTRVVDAAFDQGVIKPNKAQVINFAVFLGIVIPVVVMLLLDFFDNKLQDRKQIEAGTTVPVIGELSFTKKGSGSVINPKSRGILAEQFRLIRANLQYLGDANNQVKTMLVTSFMSGEGKSFASVNLAGSLSNNETKVLLIEMDLRKPSFSKYFNIQAKYGLTDFIVNHSITPEELLIKIPGVDHVSVIASGPLPPNPIELLMSSKLSTLFDWAKKNFDYVVIDTSPVGLVADGFLKDKYVDFCFFMLRHQYSYKTTIAFVDKLNKERKFKRMGIIVNGIKDTRTMGYGYGYNYGYGYGYGYGQYGMAEETLIDKVLKFFRLKK